MKINNFYRAILPLLLAFLNVCGSTAFSYNSAVPNLDPRNYDYLQEDQNTSAYLLQEITSGSPVHVVTKNDLVPGTDFISGKGFFFRNSSEENILPYIYTRDKKDSLTIFLFPFHFFW